MTTVLGAVNFCCVPNVHANGVQWFGNPSIHKIRDASSPSDDFQKTDLYFMEKALPGSFGWVKFWPSC